MKNKNLDKIIKSIQKVTGNKKCSLHEPWFDKSEIMHLKKAIKNNSVSTYGEETVKFEKK